MNTKQKKRLLRFVKQLEQYRGRHTELVSIYIPQGYDLNKIIQHVQDEQGTASNIKDKTNRNNVIDSLERIVRHLRLFKQTPPNGLAVFAGNISNKENKVDIEVFSIEPPEPVQLRTYRCDQTFLLDPLKDMIEDKDIYGLIVVDNREGNVGILKGNRIDEIKKFTSDVPGKTTKGGQCCHFNSLVQINDGRIIKIKNLHNPFVLKSLDISNYRFKNSPIVDKWDTRKKIAYKIITKFPRLDISTSKDHMFYVYDNGIKEKYANKLKIGDKLLMPERIDIKGKTQKLNRIFYYNSYSINKSGRDILKKKRELKKLFQNQLAKKLNLTQTAISVIELGKRSVSYNILEKVCKELNVNFSDFIDKYCVPTQSYKLPTILDKKLSLIIGYLVGDGNIEKTRLSFSERDKETAGYYKNLISSYFNCNTNLRFRENKNYFELRIQGQPISKMIKNEFPEIKNNKTSQIPEKILKSSNGVLASFLRGLYDAEGFCSGGKVSLAMNDEIFIRQIQMALLRFGIISSFLEYDSRRNPYTKNHKFIIDLTEKQSIILFKKFIGFTYSKKQEKLDYLISKMSGRSSVRQVLFSGKKTKDIMKSLGINTSTRKLSGLNNYFINKSNISKASFRRILLKYPSNNLKKELLKIVDIPVLPVQISKIHILEQRVPMSDISVKNQNFIADCVLVHNSQQRYARIREIAAKEFHKKIAEVANKEFLEMKNLKGILLGGPGPTKETFLNENVLNNEIRKKILAIKDLSYTGDFGLKELVEKSNDVLSQQSSIKEKELLDKFFTLLAKEPKKVVYGEEKTIRALEMSAVDIVIISDNMEDTFIDEVEEKAALYGTTVEVVSAETEMGNQLKQLGGVAGFLRYE